MGGLRSAYNMAQEKEGFMAAKVLARFTARDGSGEWVVTTAGIRVGGALWRFTDHSSVVCAIIPGHDETHAWQYEEDDDLGLWVALAVYQETGSLTDAGLTAWVLDGKRVRTEVEHREIAGSIRLTINGVSASRQRNRSVCYVEEGRQLTLAAQEAYFC